MVHPLADKTRARNDAEVAIFAVDQIQDSREIQLVQMFKTEQRPEFALGRGVNQWVQILQMSLKQFSGYADGDMGSELRGNTATVHLSPLGGANNFAEPTSC
jgi:hypothetical protein